MSRILVTGSEGFIGKSAVLALESAGHEVVTLDLRQSSSTRNHYIGDIRTIDLEELFEKIRPEIVVHLAAQVIVTESFVDPIYDLEVNALGTLKMIQAAIKSGCSNFCYIHSGGAVYDSEAALPLTENSPERPVSPYGLTKRIGEGYVRVLSEVAGMSWSSLAYSNVYGPVKEHGKGVIFEFWNALEKGETAVIFGANITRDFLYINDAVRAIVRAVANPTNTRINISSGIETSLNELYKLVAKKMQVEKVPRIEPPRAGEILQSCLSNEKAKIILDWLPEITLEKGIELCIPISEVKNAK
jgi:UDP-glucose 4-epimerase